jgi:protein-tyrosine phosphatase
VIDIHSHILPGVDDGAQTLNEALDMLRMAVDGGVSIQYLTPHIYAGK